MHCIDFHTHAFSDAVAEKAMTYLVEESGYTPAHDGTLRGLKSELQRVGIDKAVVLSIATKPKQVNVINDWILDCHAQSIQDGNGDGPYFGLVFFGALHPKFDDPEAEIERLRAAGIRGVKLHPNYQEFYPDDPSLLPMFKALANAGLIVLIHAGHDIAFPDAPGSPDRLARLNDAVPDLPLVCAHFGGWRMWDDVERLLVGRPNVYLDTSFTLGDLPDDRFVDVVRRHGVENVLFATDSPWRDQKLDLDYIARLPFTPEELDAILWENAARLLE